MKASQRARHKARSCEGKQRLGEHAARRAARTLTDHGDATHAYACQHCRTWHVGDAESPLAAAGPGAGDAA